MDYELSTAAYRLLAATLAGGIIGIERAYHGRPAGFRTHILVCMASSLLMVLVHYQWQTIPSDYINSIRIDPTRMAQGIMTGIGFLGAGVIMHDRHMVRGLTTAASIWITSAIGIIIGSGFFSIGIMATLLSLATLSLFRLLENKLPTRHYARLNIYLAADEAPSEESICKQLKEKGFRYKGIAYSLLPGTRTLALQMTISTYDESTYRSLFIDLSKEDKILELKLQPLDD